MDEEIQKEILLKITDVERILIEMKILSQPFNDKEWEGHPRNNGKVNGATLVAEVFPNRVVKMKKLEQELTEIVPSNYTWKSGLLRHIHFGEVHDWQDINNRDLPTEFENLSDYKEEFSLIRAVARLHSAVASVVPLLFHKDYDTALTKAFKKLEVELRVKTGLKNKSTVDLVRQAYNKKVLKYSDQTKQDATRDFLCGVFGLFRNYIIHHEVLPSTQSLYYCFPLLVICSEAFKILDRSSK